MPGYELVLTRSTVLSSEQEFRFAGKGTASGKETVFNFRTVGKQEPLQMRLMALGAVLVDADGLPALKAE